MQTSTKTLLAIVGVVLTAALIGIGILIGYYGKHHHTSDFPSTTTTASSRLLDEEVRRRLFASIDSENIRNHLRRLTAKSHPAGTAANWEVGEYIYNSYKSSGLEGVHYANYDVLLSRPNETTPNSIRILNADGSEVLSLKTREVTSGMFENSYFAYAPSSSVNSNSIVYANLARDEDFKHLKSQNIDASGSIVIARYGGYRGDQVKTAAKYGAKAIMLFLDPSAVAPHGIHPSQVYPYSQWMPGSAMERGSVFLGKGDPQSQGFVSELYGNLTYRAQPNPNDMPQIPGTPIGYADARRLFELMRSSTSSKIPKSWEASTFLNYTYGGKLMNNRKIIFTTTSYEISKPIRNVIGRIQGCEEPDRYVILGNHYDAWTMGGIDPNSGTAVILEAARAFGELRKSGWCPRRTIVFGSWDAEEYGLIGSTEWVEENLQVLHERAAAYINIDAAVRGRISFRALSMPLLNDLIYESTKVVSDPHLVPDGNISLSVYDVWANNSASDTPDSKPELGKVSAGSDYASFVNMVGITSADIRYVGEKSNPAYHTGFETFEYVEKHIDPDFKFHVAVGQVWVEIVRSLAESEILPFSVMELAGGMKEAWATLRTNISTDDQHAFSQEINLDALSQAIKTFGHFARNLDLLVSKVKENNTERAKNQTLVNEINNRLMKIERMFVDPSGLPNRPLIRHILQAPSKANAYGSTSFAGIADCVAFAKEAIEKGDEGGKNYWIDQLKLHYTKVVQMVHRAARFLAIPSGIDPKHTEGLSR